LPGAIEPSDEGKHYAVISELTAKTLWPGKESHRPAIPSRRPHEEKPIYRDRCSRKCADGLAGYPDPMMVYMPYWYRSDTNGGLLVRTRKTRR
jgi:hypothetical protein